MAVIGTEEELRALYGAPSQRAAVKVIGHLDRHCRDFIAHSPFMVLATSDGARLDVSPKGDPAGFVQVEDDHHLIVPDRPGNNRIDGLLNLLRNPAVALIFFIPSVDETLRVNVTAEIRDDEELRQLCALKGKLPKTVLRVRVHEVFSHCGKAPLRGGLWKPETWPAKRPVATLTEIVRDHSGHQVDSVEQSAVDELYRRTLYQPNCLTSPAIRRKSALVQTFPGLYAPVRGCIARPCITRRRTHRREKQPVAPGDR
jgi:PPOX class probable FMN-dependent enzyme